MRRFTFSTGNIRKILALPVYGLGAIASAFVPRTDRLWVFGSGTGVGEGALALLEHVRKVDPNLRIVWMARNDDDILRAEALGIRAVHRSSWRGFRLTLRASIIVVTHGFGDANRFGNRGGFVVQLWHGIPFKRLHIDSAAAMHVPVLSRFALFRSAVRRAYTWSGRGIDMFVVASERAAERIRTAFALSKERIAVAGDPRDDTLFAEDPSARDRSAKKRLASLHGDARVLTDRVLLYAPTWRDGRRDPSIPDADDWKRIRDYLNATNSLLIVRSHPLGSGDYSDGPWFSDRIWMLGSKLCQDITPLLPAFDALITDYSSIAFDYALLERPITYLAPDVIEYIHSRGVYENYKNFSGGSEVASWSSLIALLTSADADPAIREKLCEHASWLAHRFHAFHDGKNTERVYDEIKRRTTSSFNGAATLQPNREAVLQRLVVESVQVDSSRKPQLTMSGSWCDVEPRTARVNGARSKMAATLTVHHQTWNLSLPLVNSSWGETDLPPQSGSYSVQVLDDKDRPFDLSFATQVPEPALHEALFRLRFSAMADALTLTFTAPFSEREFGPQQQARLEAEYRNSSAPAENAVFFESFYGRNASCNPLGLDRALAKTRPGITRYWSVADASVEVPEGSVAVIEGSEAWWQARASAKLLVVNDWLRKRFRKRVGHTVLQTWHGTPLKRIAIGRRGMRIRKNLAARRESSRWDLMLAQNEFSAATFRSSYAFSGPIWLEGYPRDDVLVTGDASAIRGQLGIETDSKVVLYAPTWRDDVPGKVDHLDLQRFTRELGPGYVTLVRGHSRTMAPGESVNMPGAIDVTTYPDIADLFLVADALVTDYSSVMFDFTVTGKPIVFYVPDLDHYRDHIRGFNFDLLPVAPGPVLRTTTDVIGYLREMGSLAAEYADKYRQWQERFNPHDDGNAGERIVTRLINEGYLD